MRSKEPLPPFYKGVMHLKDLFGVDDQAALDKVRSVYSEFKRRNESLASHQNNQQNTVQVQLISHFALLATLTLTVTGFLLTQTSASLSDLHKFLILGILLSEITSLFLGAYDYYQTIVFHQRWAELYHGIGTKVDKMFSSGELQWTNQLGEVEERELKLMPAQTKMWVTYCTIGFCLLGLLILLLLFYGFFFDVPYIK